MIQKFKAGDAIYWCENTPSAACTVIGVDEESGGMLVRCKEGVPHRTMMAGWRKFEPTKESEPKMTGTIHQIEITTVEQVIKERDAARESGLKLLAELNAWRHWADERMPKSLLGGGGDTFKMEKIGQDLIRLKDWRKWASETLTKNGFHVSFAGQYFDPAHMAFIGGLVKDAANAPKLPIPLPDGHELVWFGVAKELDRPLGSIQDGNFYWGEPCEQSRVGWTYTVIARPIVKQKTKEEIEHDAACAEYQEASRVFGIAQARRAAAAKAWRDAK